MLEVRQSARKHGVDGKDIEHVVEHALAVLDEENDEGLIQVPYLGWDRPGDALLEAVVLDFDDGREMAIHAMKMQPRYRRYLVDSCRLASAPPRWPGCGYCPTFSRRFASALPVTAWRQVR